MTETLVFAIWLFGFFGYFFETRFGDQDKKKSVFSDLIDALCWPVAAGMVAAEGTRRWRKESAEKEVAK